MHVIDISNTYCHVILFTAIFSPTQFPWTNLPLLVNGMTSNALDFLDRECLAVDFMQDRTTTNVDRELHRLQTDRTVISLCSCKAPRCIWNHGIEL